MKPLHLFSALLLATSALFTTSAQAGLMMGPTNLSASTSMVSIPGFTINQLTDGISSDTAPYNGFATNSATGTISLNLLGGSHDLNSFYLWNDINILQEGIQTFRLDFYNAANTLVSSTGIFTTLLTSPVSGETFSFATVNGINKVNLVILSSKVGGFANRIEVREVAFNAVPVPSTLLLLFGGLSLLALTGQKKVLPATNA